MGNFEEFQKLEYERIAEAHFKTIDAISSFFRYYLIIMSLPPTAAALVLSREKWAEPFAFPQFSSQTEILIGIALMVLASVGLCLMLYVLNLRMDGILYARTVNAIRKYFYDHSDIDVAAKQQLRVLPQTRFQPAYAEPRYFFPVVVTFASLDSAYFIAGFVLWSHGMTQQYFELVPSFVVLVLFFATHFFFYFSYAHHREHGYLKTSAIGIDIDGVLNQHREQFCKIFKAKTGRTIAPNRIKRIPVSDNPQLRVDNAEEIGVFHDPTYWTKMPVADGAPKIISKLRNDLNLQIHIFSYRPWPVPGRVGADMKAWSKELNQLRRDTKMFNMTIPKIPETLLVRIWNFPEVLSNAIKENWLALCRKIFVWLPWARSLDRITHLWLYKNHFPYDRLIIEKGHINLASPNARFVNRFNKARRHRLRFFVEDDLEKAEKMAHICDVVFLVDHPYNKTTHRLAGNIRRVNNWDDIFREVRRLS